jgi:hypothetical protein
MRTYPTLSLAVDGVRRGFLEAARPIHPKYWQATDVGDRPEAEMMEQTFVSFAAQTPASSHTLEKLLSWGLNMPWAEDHFLERVGGLPVNPGTTWKDWPWSNSADTHRTDGRFNHNYMERYWPKHAGDEDCSLPPMQGIREPYGDLDDVVNQLEKDPLTRQAYLPVFFPEDTGAVHGGRVPCSIGYHFMIRDKELHCTYQLRSCDIYRHFVDDVYLTTRLMQWVADQLFERDIVLRPGILHVHIGSLHCFKNDFRSLAKTAPR